MKIPAFHNRKEASSAVTCLSWGEGAAIISRTLIIVKAYTETVGNKKPMDYQPLLKSDSYYATDGFLPQKGSDSIM